ncbi:MAG: anti-sigma factor [Actinomycetota bacterium]|nr:anti-sigma factor [Actinomycetota bacterium]
MLCEQTIPELSARLDGECSPELARKIDEHLASCPQCARRAVSIARVRKTIRTRPAESVPDLSEAILERVREESVVHKTRREWRVRLRLGAAAAVVSALILAGVSIPFRDGGPAEVALASDIVRAVSSAARALDNYEATISVIERGWHPRVPIRRFDASLAFSAPESFRLRITDLTDYPRTGDWRPQDVLLVANPRAWWIEEPPTCPAAALRPRCDLPAGLEQRSLVERRPFDGTIGLPTDIVLPLKTLSTTTGLRVEGLDTVAGRSAYRISLSYRRAVPLISSLQAGGSWRPLHPSDRVTLWLDEQTWFPLKFSVVAGSSAEREVWSRVMQLSDRPGMVLLEAETTDFSEPPRLSSDSFAIPDEGTIASGGFQEEGGEAVEAELAPSYVAGLRPYRSGTTRQNESILAYARGMSWLKVVGRRDGGAAAPAAQEVRLQGGWGYYEPATLNRGRLLHVFGSDSSVTLEANLPRHALMNVAESLPVSGRRLRSLPSSELRRVPISAVDKVGFAHTPERPPDGYALRAATIARSPGGRTLTLYYRGAESEFDGLGIRITHSTGVALLPPSPGHLVNVSVGDQTARWFPERGEVDWLEDGVYTTVAAPSFDLGTILQVARSLR